MLPPVPMFCCGCSVRWGVRCILFFHLLACLFYTVCACSNMIGRHPIFFSGWGVNAQLFYLGFSMAGIPVIIGAFLGIRHHVEITFRLYLYYLCVSFGMNVWGLIYFVFIRDPCSVGSFYGWISFEFGGAFLCGVFRTASAVLFTTIVTMEVYSIWVVWSYSQDMSDGKTGPEMSELIMNDTGFGSGLVLKENREDGGYAGEYTGGGTGAYRGAGVVGLTPARVGPAFSHPWAYGTISPVGAPRIAF